MSAYSLNDLQACSAAAGFGGAEALQLHSLTVPFPPVTTRRQRHPKLVLPCRHLWTGRRAISERLEGAKQGKWSSCHESLGHG